MIDATQLTSDLKRLVVHIEDDLRARVDGADPDLREAGAEERWRASYDDALKARRTSSTWSQWRDDQVTQAAVSWVLATVFIRFCEDNRLVSPVWIEGPRERRQEAQDARTAYFRANPTHTDREWLRQPITHLQGVPAARDLVDTHTPLWLVAPSGRAAERILAFWHERGDDGELVRDFTDETLSTRFLGDLYQDLSDHAKSTYALLQTPDFVEEFILDRTLEPALAERPLAGFRMIDPTCGSGHFLLGAFHRLLDRWQRHEPDTNITELAGRALDSVYGVDLNPFAVAIARFRLVIAALQACGERSLERAPGWTVHVVAGDSLLHGQKQEAFDLGVALDTDAKVSGFAYATEDLDALKEILRAESYDAVVGNPPYITVKDKALNKRYREFYNSCKGTYALTVPFMERFFGLARVGDGERPAGWVGQITSNSFMKRGFGSKLIENFLPKQDLRLVIDTSGAYIPGHGTPTVIIVGRPQRPVGDTVRAVLGIRGEPGKPEVPADGLVWRSIVDHIDLAGHEDDYTSTADLPRKALATHPWSLTGGGADLVISTIEEGASPLQKSVSLPIGGSIRAGADEAYMRPICWRSALPENQERLRPLVVGDATRDWSITPGVNILFPYVYGSGEKSEGLLSRELWSWRTLLKNRSTFQGNMEDAGLQWWEFMQFTKMPYRTPLSIAFAFVATHNHFVLDRGGKVFNRSAPVIKLPEGATEEDHLKLLGVLNSSTACFWLKQNSHQKASAAMGGGMIDQPWSWNWEFTGTTLQNFPLPQRLPLVRSGQIHELSQRISSSFVSVFDVDSMPSAEVIAQVRRDCDILRGEMVAVQEELDWEVYQSYGLTDTELTLPDGEELPEVKPGERAFAIWLARQVENGTAATRWFSHPNHQHAPVTEIPAHWPAAYRELVQRRLDLIADDRFIGLLERPEYKRRWAAEPWDKRVEKALRSWLLDRLERRDYWFDKAGRPRPLSIGQLADKVARDPDLTGVLALWAGHKDIDITATLIKLLDAEAVPYLAAQRLKEPGLRKRRDWEHTWELQRAEDRGETVGDIPVPPKYTSADFRKSSYWSHRGKLDVPKERFIAYPGGGRITDPTPLLGWAGWDHAQQSLALATIIAERENDGVPDETLIPLVAGMHELQPWVEQWHGTVDDYGINLADFTREMLRDRMTQLGVTHHQLLDWRPTAPTRGRRTRTTTKGS